MQYKTIIMVAVFLAVFANMTMARNLQESSENENTLDESRFSLRKLLQLVAPEKRKSVCAAGDVYSRNPRRPHNWACVPISYLSRERH